MQILCHSSRLIEPATLLLRLRHSIAANDGKRALYTAGQPGRSAARVQREVSRLRLLQKSSFAGSASGSTTTTSCGTGTGTGTSTGTSSAES